MLLLLACAEDTDSDGKDSPAGWSEPFAWTLDAAEPCPAEVPEGDAAGELAGALGQAFPFGIPDDRFTGKLRDDDTRLSWYPAAIADLTAVPCLARNHADRHDAAFASDHPLTTVVADGAAILDQPITVGGTFAEEPLGDALAALGAGEVDLSSVPEEVQTAAATLLVAIAEVIQERDAALAAMMPDGKPNHAFDDGASYWLVQVGDALDPAEADYHDLYVGSAEGSARLYAAGARLAQAIDEVELSADSASFHVQVDTDYGAVILNGGAADTYDTTPTLLVIDTGGDDTWLGPSGATADQDHPVSVAIDLAGDDVYAYDGTDSGVDGVLPDDADGRYYDSATNGPYSRSTVVRQGAGVLGYGFLVDRGGGADQYTSLRRSQGYAQFGVGILDDDGGDDVYQGEAGVQGAACVGIAALIDRGGDDRYKAWTSAQGFAWVSSTGALWDGAGNDSYELVADDPMLFWSSQTQGATNNNVGQGAGFGLYNDATDPLSGGIGLLRDVSGDDAYVGATYVQGAGYMMGTGALVDGDGADVYAGSFYAQGTGVHYGMGVLLDDAGDDAYNADDAPMSATTGLGHDSGIGVVVDLGGDDQYSGADRAIGAGKCHGLGLFVDRGGDDTYVATSDRAMGWATDYDVDAGDCGDDTDVATWGLFVDLDGADTYDKPFGAMLGDDSQWITDDPGAPDALQLSGGLDTTGGDSFAR